MELGGRYANRILFVVRTKNTPELKVKFPLSDP